MSCHHFEFLLVPILLLLVPILLLLVPILLLLVINCLFPLLVIQILLPLPLPVHFISPPLSPNFLFYIFHFCLCGEGGGGAWGGE